MTHTRNHTRAAALAATCLSLAALTAPAAGAMETQNFAPEDNESAAVVAERVSADGEMGECSGTAIAPRWVLTASHCIQEQREVTGAIRIGQGDKQREVPIEDWQVVGDDVALIRTAEDIGLDHYPKLDTTKRASGEATAYGWSVDGSGGGKRLPKAKMKITEPIEGTSLIKATTTDGAMIQPGDSGAPLFYEGMLSAVLTAGIDTDTDMTPGSFTAPQGAEMVAPAPGSMAPGEMATGESAVMDPSTVGPDSSPEEKEALKEMMKNMKRPTGAYTSVAPYAEKVQQIIAADAAGEMSPAAEANKVSPLLLGGIGAVIVVAIGASIIALRRRKPAAEEQ
ncbi:trypsin-like serine protease [Corynebacterium atypicum]|nr:trypsin-like serine protease [Corynebacterium atypicum]